MESNPRTCCIRQTHTHTHTPAAAQHPPQAATDVAPDLLPRQAPRLSGALVVSGRGPWLLLSVEKHRRIVLERVEPTFLCGRGPSQTRTTQRRNHRGKRRGMMRFVPLPRISSTSISWNSIFCIFCCCWILCPSVRAASPSRGASNGDRQI